MDAVVVLALAALSGAHAWDRTLSTNVHELSGYTVMLKHSVLVVISPTGARKEIGL